MQARTANVILIANVEANSVSLLDEDTQQLLKEIPVGVNPHEVVVTSRS